MQESDSTSIDYEDLKRRLREAIRAVIQERADELGISYAACLELLRERSPPASSATVSDSGGGGANA